MLFSCSCCWSKACCCIRGRAAAGTPWYCAILWARDSVLLSIEKSAGNPEGRAEENDGGAPAMLGVAMEKIGVEREWLSPGVCIGKLFNDMTGVDKGWSWAEATMPCRLCCWYRKHKIKVKTNKNANKTLLQ